MLATDANLENVLDIRVQAFASSLIRVILVEEKIFFHTPLMNA